MEAFRYSNMEQKNLYQKKKNSKTRIRETEIPSAPWVFLLKTNSKQQLSAHATPRQAVSMPS